MNSSRKQKNTKKPRNANRHSEAPLNDFAALQAILHMGPSQSDPDGMYTGKPVGFDLPIQDGDDL